MTTGFVQKENLYLQLGKIEEIENYRQKSFVCETLLLLTNN